MLDTDNASRSSVDDDTRTDDRSAAKSPPAAGQEEMPSLHMLEESAAQLAALRQRAENLLDQLAAGEEHAPSHAKSAGAVGGNRNSSVNHRGETRPTHSPPAPGPDEPAPARRPPEDAGPAANAGGERQERNGAAAVPPAPAVNDSGDGPAPPGDSFSYPVEESYPLQAPHPPSPDGDFGSALPFSGQAPTVGSQQAPTTPAYPLQRPHPEPQAQPQSVLDSPARLFETAQVWTAEGEADGRAGEAQLIDEEIASLYDSIDYIRETRRENTGHALALLREARMIISVEPLQLARAEYNIQQARQILDRARSGRNRSRGIALRAIGLLLLWLAALGALGALLYLYPQEVNALAGYAAETLGWEIPHISPVLWAVVAGGAGGCLGTVSFLLERARVHQEFDRLYIVRSTVQPLMGVLLGLTLYCLLALLFNNLGSSLSVHPVTAYLPAAIAIPIGIWQVYVYAIIFRFTRLFTFRRRRRW